MSKPLEPGTRVKFTYDPVPRRKKGDHNIPTNGISSEVPITVATIILAVTAKTLLVPEYRSVNGLAFIECHGGSQNTGQYWYSYISAGLEKFESPGMSREFDITSLLIDVGDKYFPVHQNVFLR